MSLGKLINRNGTMTVDPNASGTIDTTGDQMVIDVTDVRQVLIQLVRVVGVGTVALNVEKSVDGVVFTQIITKVDTDFPAGNNKAIELTLSDVNGMPTACKQVRLTATALAGGGVYGLKVSGYQAGGFA